MHRLVLSIVLLFFASPLAGQTPPLESGAPLRVHARSFTLSGELVRLGADTLVLRTQGSARTGNPSADRAIAVADLVRLDHKVPRTRGQGAARGALWGLVIGGVAGGFLGAITEQCGVDRNCIGPTTRTEGLLLGGAVLGALGAGVGALAGTAWPGSRWEPTTLEGAETQSR